MSPPRQLSRAVLLLALACAAPRPPPASTRSEPPQPVPWPASPGAYGEEPRVQPTALEQRAASSVAARLGSPPPRLSPPLVLAARELAARAARGEDRPLARPRLRVALARGLAFDPAPAAFLVEASPEDAPALLARAAAGAEPATDFGIGAEVSGGRACVVLLLARRSAALRPFPREVAVGARAVLRGELRGLERATVHVTPPSGSPFTLGAGPGRAFAAPISFDRAGRWLIEVVGSGPRGPEVAVLLTVASGGAALDSGERPEPAEEPASLEDAEAQVARAVNDLRRASGLPALALDPAASAVARRHSEAMAAQGVLAHVLGGADVGERLRRAHVPFAVVRENVAKGGAALEAHRTAEESPAHRQNLLATDVSRLGCGIARTRSPGGEAVTYLTEVFLEPVEDGSEERLTPEGRVREVLWAERQRLEAPPLTSDPRLDELARAGARAMMRAGEPSQEGLAERALALGRKVAATDVYVAARATDAARSRNLTDPSYRRVGVGVAIGDSPRYGAGVLWIAVIYTD